MSVLGYALSTTRGAAPRIIDADDGEAKPRLTTGGRAKLTNTLAKHHTDYRFRKKRQTWLTGQSLQRGLLVLQIVLPC